MQKLDIDAEVEQQTLFPANTQNSSNSVELTEHSNENSEDSQSDYLLECEARFWIREYTTRGKMDHARWFVRKAKIEKKRGQEAANKLATQMRKEWKNGYRGQKVSTGINKRKGKLPASYRIPAGKSK